MSKTPRVVILRPTHSARNSSTTGCEICHPAQSERESVALWSAGEPWRLETFQRLWRLVGLALRVEVVRLRPFQRLWRMPLQRFWRMVGLALPPAALAHDGERLLLRLALVHLRKMPCTRLANQLLPAITSYSQLLPATSQATTSYQPATTSYYQLPASYQDSNAVLLTRTEAQRACLGTDQAQTQA